MNGRILLKVRVYITHAHEIHESTYGLENSTGKWVHACIIVLAPTFLLIKIKRSMSHGQWLFFIFRLFGKNNKIKQKRFMQKIKIRLVKSDTA